MAIEPRYRATCDAPGCGCEGPISHTEHDAWALAMADGWNYTTQQGDLCPTHARIPQDVWEMGGGPATPDDLQRTTA